MWKLRGSHHRVLNSNPLWDGSNFQILSIMRKFMSNFLICSVFVFCCAFTTTSNEVTLKEQDLLEDEGLHCRVRNDSGDVIASCWFCNCAKLAEAAR